MKMVLKTKFASWKNVGLKSLKNMKNKTFKASKWTEM